MAAITARKEAMREAWERDGGRCVMCGRYTEAPPHHLLIGEERKIKEYHGEDTDAIMTLCGPSELNCHYTVQNWSRAHLLAWLTGLRSSRKGQFPWERVYQILKRKYAHEAMEVTR